jgi:hypothetical protein
VRSSLKRLDTVPRSLTHFAPTDLNKSPYHTMEEKIVRLPSETILGAPGDRALSGLLS